MHIGAFLGATHVLGVQHFGEREANAKRHAVHGSEKSRGHGQRGAAAGGQIYVSDMCSVHDRWWSLAWPGDGEKVGNTPHIIHWHEWHTACMLWMYVLIGTCLLTYSCV